MPAHSQRSRTVPPPPAAGLFASLQARRRDPEIQHPLTIISQQAVSLVQEQAQLDLSTGRADVPHDPTPTTDRLRDLNRRGPRGRTNRPNPGHSGDPTDPN